MPEKRTPEGRANKARMNREMRGFYRERGICVVCGQTWAEPGYVRCKACYKKAIAKMHRRDPDGKKHAEYVKQLREERKAKGLCVDCGAKTDGLHVRCAVCHERQLESSRIYKMKKRMKREAEKERRAILERNARP